MDFLRGYFFATLYIFTKTHFLYFMRKVFSFCAKSNNYRCSSNVFSLAAKNGYSHAYYYLGNQFYYGLGFTQDYEKAFDYYLKADRKGDKYAAYRLGKMYLSGEGVNIDIQQAEIGRAHV